MSGKLLCSNCSPRPPPPPLLPPPPLILHASFLLSSLFPLSSLDSDKKSLWPESVHWKYFFVQCGISLYLAVPWNLDGLYVPVSNLESLEKSTSEKPFVFLNCFSSLVWRLVFTVLCRNLMLHAIHVLVITSSGEKEGGRKDDGSRDRARKEQKSLFISFFCCLSFSFSSLFAFSSSFSFS